jgi:hypothetical protein
VQLKKQEGKMVNKTRQEEKEFRWGLGKDEMEFTNRDIERLMDAFYWVFMRLLKNEEKSLDYMKEALTWNYNKTIEDEEKKEKEKLLRSKN